MAILHSIDEVDEDAKNSLLSPEDAKKQGEIADGVERIRVSHLQIFHSSAHVLETDSLQLKRQHSVEPSLLDSPTSATPGKVTKITEESFTKSDSSPLFLTSEVYDPSSDLSMTNDAMIGSPLKKSRQSTAGLDNEIRRTTAENLSKGLGFGFSPNPDKNDSKAEVQTFLGGPIKPDSKENLVPSDLPAADVAQAVKVEDLA